MKYYVDTSIWLNLFKKEGDPRKEARILWDKLRGEPIDESALKAWQCGNTLDFIKLLGG